jgi:hypothetical protein
MLRDAQGFPDLRIYGFSDLWIYGFLDFRIPGFLDLRIYGFPDFHDGQHTVNTRSTRGQHTVNTTVNTTLFIDFTRGNVLAR